MPEIPRSRLVAYAACALIVLAVGAWSLRGEAGGSAGRSEDGGTTGHGAPGAADGAGEGGEGAGEDALDGTRDGVSVAAPAASPATVHVAGAVRRTGVYRLAGGARVKDAVERAGGATPEANLDGINLAAKVADGQQVVVPERVAAAAGGAPSSDAPAGGAAPPAAPVGLNAATLEQLQTLDGVGPATAEKIVAWRTEHGGFRSVDDLGQVAGIGPKRLAALRDRVQP